VLKFENIIIILISENMKCLIKCIIEDTRFLSFISKEKGKKDIKLLAVGFTSCFEVLMPLLIVV
jgi:hypothetical protein